MDLFTSMTPYPTLIGPFKKDFNTDHKIYSYPNRPLTKKSIKYDIY